MDDILYTQSMLEPRGAVPSIVPCVFPAGTCRGDPRHPGKQVRPTFADVAWGSVLPLLASYTVQLTADTRLAARAAGGAADYVAL